MDSFACEPGVGEVARCSRHPEVVIGFIAQTSGGPAMMWMGRIQKRKMGKRKNPAWNRVGSRPGMVSAYQWEMGCLTIPVSRSFGGRDALPTQCFALFATSEFAWLFIAFLQLQAFEKAVILDLFL
jgi:hypothetical protein